MEDLFVLGLGLAVLAALLGAPVLAVIAIVRTGASGALGRRIQRLEQRLQELEAAGPLASPPPAPAPPAAPPAPAAPGPVPLEVEAPAPDPVAATVAPRAPAPSGPPEPEAPLAPAPKRTSIEWERWLGVRGAAVLGGVFLALAGLLFFQYSVQRGWITPPLRVGTGVVAGIAALIGSRVLRARAYRITADALGGSGVVILYGASWAAHTLYDLVPGAVALAAMALVTAGCGLMALRHQSLPVAVFGLVGGFATPLLLSVGAEAPLGLFGYLLLLDLGLVIVGRRAGWPLLGALGALGSSIVYGYWTVAFLHADDLLPAMAFLGIAAVLFALSGTDRRWLAGQSASLLLPVPFAVYFATRAELQGQLVPLGLLLAVLTLTAAWVARAQRAPWLAGGAAAGTVATLGVWSVVSLPHTGSVWTLSFVVVGLAGLLQVGLELARRRRPELGPGPTGAALVLDLGLLGVLALAAVLTASDGPWAFAFGGLLLALTLARLGAFAGWPPVQLLGAGALALGWTAWRHLGTEPVLQVGALAEIAARLALPLALFAPALLQRREGRAWALRAVALAALLLLGDLILLEHWPAAPALHLGGAAALVALALAVSALGRCSPGAAGAVVGWVATLGLWREDYLDAGLPPWLLVLTGLAVLAGLVLTPALAGQRLRSALAGTAAGLAPLAVFPFVGQAFQDTRLSNWMSTAGGEGLLPLALALAGLAHFAATRWTGGARTLHSIVAVVFACSAIPLEIGREVPIVATGACVLGLALLTLSPSHAGARGLPLVLSLLLLPLVGIGALELLGDPYGRSGWPIFHWASYVFGLPAAALLVAGPVLGHRQGKLVGLIGILLAFLWINLEIVNLFSTGELLDLDLERQAARDLAMSVGWALFAATLLAVGVRRQARGLRWVSLGFLLAATFKVFLYDLGELAGLYRVGSLVGLAFTLLAVSLVYQRFVFRRADLAGA